MSTPNPVPPKPPNAAQAEKEKLEGYAKTNRKPLIIGAILMALMVIVVFGFAKCAHADTNLALECFSSTPATVKPTSCPQGWTWHTPGQGAVVITQTGSWRIFNVPPTTDAIAICTANVSPGTASTGCPKANVVYQAGCNAAGQSCTALPPTPPLPTSPRPTPSAPVASSVTINWLPPTQNADGSALTDLAGWNIYRGHKADGSDLVAFSGFGNIGAVSYVDATVTPGATWCYALTALNKAKVESDKSNVACKTIDPAPVAATWPNPPTNVTVVAAAGALPSS